LALRFRNPQALAVQPRLGEAPDDLSPNFRKTFRTSSLQALKVRPPQIFGGLATYVGVDRCSPTPIGQENTMLRKTLFAALLASSAMALAVTTPAHADKRDRAQEAIAAAEAKIHTAESLGTSTASPAATADARASLAIAREELKSGHKSNSIAAAIRASALADTAIGESQRSKDEAIAAANAAQREGVAAAHDQAAAAQDQAAGAQDQAAAARQQAADANARADAAQQSAAASAAEAAAARNAAALAAQTPPTQVETSVTTQQPASAHRTTRTHVTRRTTTTSTPAASSVTTTTTKVTQPPPN
jgi:hypothetical protein